MHPSWQYRDILTVTFNRPSSLPAESYCPEYGSIHLISNGLFAPATREFFYHYALNMDLWGYPFGWGFGALYVALLAPSTDSPTRRPVVPKKEELKLDLAQMLRELPPVQGCPIWTPPNDWPFLFLLQELILPVLKVFFSTIYLWRIDCFTANKYQQIRCSDSRCGQNRTRMAWNNHGRDQDLSSNPYLYGDPYISRWWGLLASHWGANFVCREGLWDWSDSSKSSDSFILQTLTLRPLYEKL